MKFNLILFFEYVLLANPLFRNFQYLIFLLRVFFVQFIVGTERKMLMLKVIIVIAGCLIVSSNASESENEDKSKILLKKLFVRRREVEIVEIV